MNEFYTSSWPENDYRYYLQHSFGSKSHKYISRKKGKNGKWIYTYTKKAVNRLSNAWNSSVLSAAGRRKRRNAEKVWNRMMNEDEAREHNLEKNFYDYNRTQKESKAYGDKLKRAYAATTATMKKRKKGYKRKIDVYD